MKKMLSIAMSLALLGTTVFCLAHAHDVDAILEEMSLEQKLGQMVMLDFRNGWKVRDSNTTASVEALNDEIKTIVTNHHIGNIVLFKSNLKDTGKSVALTDSLQKTAIETGDLPLMIAVDQEGGIVTRLGSGTCFPGNMALGATGNLDYAYTTGKIIGKEISSVGMNCNFAPDVDVNDNPENPVIHLRSFGSDVTLVSDMGRSFMDGLQAENVIATAKHFPGHGNTSVDSHTGLPLVNKTLEELKAVELAPFQHLIDNGVDMIMTAHIQFPYVDDTKYVSQKDGSEIVVPATLSKKIMTDLLRKDMHFNGVIVTDSMQMQAISENFEQVQACKLAINAGVDLICMPVLLTCMEDAEKLDQVLLSLKSAVVNGEIPMSRIDESVRRIVNLKKERGILEKKQYQTPLDSRIKTALQTVGCEEHRKIERKISSDAITVVKNESLEFPFKATLHEKILVLAPYENEIPAAKFALDRLKKENKITDTIDDFYCYYKQDGATEELKSKIQNSDRVILLTQQYGFLPDNWTATLPIDVINYMNQIKKSDDLAVVSVGRPYDIKYFHNAKTVLVAYGYIGMDPTDAGNLEITKEFEPNIPAAIEVCLGAADATCPRGLPR